MVITLHEECRAVVGDLYGYYFTRGVQGGGGRLVWLLLYTRCAGRWWETCMVITLMGRIRAWSSAACLELEQGE